MFVNDLFALTGIDYILAEQRTFFENLWMFS